MKLYSHFIKLPGEEEDQKQVEAGFPNPECYEVHFWLDRDTIQGIVEVKDMKTGELNRSTIICKNGDSYYCSLPGLEVVALLDAFDRSRPVFEHFN